MNVRIELFLNPIRSGRWGGVGGGGGRIYKPPPPIFCPHAFNFGATSFLIGNQDLAARVVSKI